MINKINTLINVTGQNKTINFSGGLLGAISENAAAEENATVLQMFLLPTTALN